MPRSAAWHFSIRSVKWRVCSLPAGPARPRSRGRPRAASPLVVGPCRSVGAGNPRHPVADLDAGFRRRGPFEHAADLDRVGLVGRLADAVEIDPDHDHERREDVHGRTGDVDLEPLPLRLGEELVRLGRGVVRRLAGHLHVAAEGDDRDAVLGVPARELEQLGAEPEREDEDADTVPPRQQECRPSSCTNTRTPSTKMKGRMLDTSCSCAGQRLSWRSPPGSGPSIRAGPGIEFLMAASVPGCCTPWRAAASSAASMLRAMAGNGTAPSRKDATATSLAAFSTTG